MSQWYVYICESRAKHYYVGISPDRLGRLKAHNKGTGSKMAKDQSPFTLVYVSKAFESKSEARKREVQLKGWHRAKKEKLIRGEYI